MRDDGKTVVIKSDADADRAYAAHQLRIQGMSWPKIAELTGYASGKSAEVETRRYVQRAAAMMDREHREEALALEMDRLDALLLAVWDQAMSGDVKAVDSAVRIVGMRARILGLEQLPTQGAVTHNTVVVSGAKTEDYVQALKLVASGG